MLSVAIDHVRTRYRLPSRARREQPRVQRIVDDALARVLEGAIERRGIEPDAYLCIRDVHAVARLRLREPDSALTSGIGDAIAVAIERLLDDKSPSIVRYGSRVQALVDLAVRATAGDFSRSWAWTQVGIWRADFPMRPDVTAEQVVRALSHEPTHAAAVIAYLARTRTDRLAELVARATPRAWSTLAEAALAAAGGPGQHQPSRMPAIGGESYRRDATPAGTPQADANREHSTQNPAASWALRALASSAVARLAIARFADTPDAVRAALAVLTLLETEPAAARRDDIVSILAAIEQAIAAAAHRAHVAPAEKERDGRDAVRSAVITPSAHDVHDAAASKAPYALDEVRQDASRHDTGVEAGRDAPPHTPPQGEESAPAVANVRQVVRTEYGGLLYLVNLLSRAGLVDGLERDQRWSTRGLRWVLHQLAMALVPIEADDPAALVFAGIAPGVVPPSTEQDPPTDDERAALETLRAAMTRALREALHDDSEPGAETDRRLIGGVCHRPARIAAEPGWIEAHFSIEDVTLDVRRAGLDRDPGWLPWLGIVLRFAYA